jgi:hypothetical protein
MMQVEEAPESLEVQLARLERLQDVAIETLVLARAVGATEQVNLLTLLTTELINRAADIEAVMVMEESF